jgi:hypothetical protein
MPSKAICNKIVITQVHNSKGMVNDLGVQVHWRAATFFLSLMIDISIDKFTFFNNIFRPINEILRRIAKDYSNSYLFIF